MVPFHLRQRFRIRTITHDGTVASTEEVVGKPAAARAAGISVSYLKWRLAMEGGSLMRRVLRDDGTWGYLSVERLDTLKREG